MSAAINGICEAVKRGLTVSCEPYNGGIGIRLFRQDEKAERPELGEHQAVGCEIDSDSLEHLLIHLPLDRT